jgi:hypothetical protein
MTKIGSAHRIQIIEGDQCRFGILWADPFYSLTPNAHFKNAGMQ